MCNFFIYLSNLFIVLSTELKNQLYLLQNRTPCQLGLKNTSIAPLLRSKTPFNECDDKPSEGEAGSLGNLNSPSNAVIPKSNLTLSSRTCQGPIYESELFNHLLDLKAINRMQTNELWLLYDKITK